VIDELTAGSSQMLLAARPGLSRHSGLIDKPKPSA
jgi:hypothetical protein